MRRDKSWRYVLTATIRYGARRGLDCHNDARRLLLLLSSYHCVCPLTFVLSSAALCVTLPVSVYGSVCALLAYVNHYFLRRGCVCPQKLLLKVSDMSLPIAVVGTKVDIRGGMSEAELRVRLRLEAGVFSATDSGGASRHIPVFMCSVVRRQGLEPIQQWLAGLSY